MVIRPPQPPSAPPHEGRAVLGPIAPGDAGKKTLVLDLDETLVHSSFKPIPDPDFIIPVEIEGKIVDVYVLKRPHMDAFMEAVGDVFETVVFTARSFPFISHENWMSHIYIYILHMCSESLILNGFSIFSCWDHYFEMFSFSLCLLPAWQSMPTRCSTCSTRVAWFGGGCFGRPAARTRATM